MPTQGVDCQIVLDGVGYFVEPRGYAMKRARLRRAALTLDGGERYLDLGPGKREWHLVLLCLSGLADYTGQPLPATGAWLREQLRAGYERVTPAGGPPGAVTLPYVDLDGAAYQVHFDDYEEQVRDPRTQLVSPGYHVAIVLVEA